MKAQNLELLKILALSYMCGKKKSFVLNYWALDKVELSSDELL